MFVLPPFHILGCFLLGSHRPQTTIWSRIRLLFKGKSTREGPSLTTQSATPPVPSNSYPERCLSRVSSSKRRRISYMKAVNNPIPIQPDSCNSSSGFFSLQSDLSSLRSRSQTDEYPPTAADSIETRLNADDLLRLVYESSECSGESDEDSSLFRPHQPYGKSSNSMENNVETWSWNKDDQLVDEPDSENQPEADIRIWSESFPRENCKRSLCRRECDDLDSRFLGCRDGSLPERHLTRNLARNLTRQEASRELRAISKRSEKSTWRKRNWDSTETVVGWKSDGSQLSMNGTEAEDGQWVWFPGTVIVSRCPYGCVRSVHQK